MDTLPVNKFVPVGVLQTTPRCANPPGSLPHRRTCHTRNPHQATNSACRERIRLSRRDRRIRLTHQGLWANQRTDGPLIAEKCRVGVSRIRRPSKQLTNGLFVLLKWHNESVEPHPPQCLQRLVQAPTEVSCIRRVWTLRALHRSPARCIAEKRWPPSNLPYCSMYFDDRKGRVGVHYHGNGRHCVQHRQSRLHRQT